MKKFPTSIRKKVNYAYYVGITLIIAIAFLNYFNLQKINQRIEFSFIASDLFDATLEMRRFEKNYFLYGYADDYNENLIYTDEAKDIISKHEKAIEQLVIKSNIYALKTDILRYSDLMHEHYDKERRLFHDQAALLEEKIRERGKEIVNTAQAISTAERQYIQSLIDSSQNTLIVSGVFLIIIGFFIARYLSRMVIRPLKLMESSMMHIAEGEFTFMPVLSRDKELMSLSKAVNKMLLELELRQKRLIQSEKLASTGTLLFGVAHEMNNPLSNISTSCEILKEEIETADIEYQRELLTQIENETDRAKEIVGTVLDFSREGKKGIINLRETVYESYRLLRGELPSKIEVHIKIPDNLTLYADKQKLEQVFLNLIKNAAESIHEEGVIRISAGMKSEDMIEIKVQDTGTGIDSETISRIFDPFFSRKDAKKGYGLGLFVVHGIIEEHRGTIDVESQSNHGTTFLLRLPVKENKS
jgi:signal transduction histidine kinase